MPSSTEMDTVRTLLVAATAITAWWVIQYTLSAPWWRDKIGRSFVLKDLFLLLLLIPTCLLQLWPRLLTVTEAFWVEVAVFGGIAAVVAGRCVLFWRIQRPRPVTMWRTSRRMRGPGERGN